MGANNPLTSHAAEKLPGNEKFALLEKGKDFYEERNFRQSLVL